MIVGEVYNGTSNYLEYVFINVNIFNVSGQLISTEFGMVSVDSLAPWTKGCFSVVVSPFASANWSSYAFDSLEYSDDALPPPNLVIYGDSGRLVYSYYSIIGFMRNNDSVLVDWIWVTATLYNAQGKVVGCDFGSTSADSLTPGQISSFEVLSVYRDSYADVTNYKLQADGSKEK